MEEPNPIVQVVSGPVVQANPEADNDALTIWDLL